MSYILDALRKSEQERQKTTGQGISLPYPVTIRHERESRLIPVLLGIVVTACVGTAIWWVFSGTDNRPAPAPAVAAAPQPKPVVADTAVESLPQPLKRTDGVRSEREHNEREHD